MKGLFWTAFDAYWVLPFRSTDGSINNKPCLFQPRPWSVGGKYLPAGPNGRWPAPHPSPRTGLSTPTVPDPALLKLTEGPERAPGKTAAGKLQALDDTILFHITSSCLPRDQPYTHALRPHTRRDLRYGRTCLSNSIRIGVHACFKRLRPLSTGLCFLALCLRISQPRS